jgi:hypothetical protein
MKALRSIPDRELAEFQASYKPTTAEWKLCEQEFIRRQGMPAARRSWIAIWISIAALALSALSALLVYFK